MIYHIVALMKLRRIRSSARLPSSRSSYSSVSPRPVPICRDVCGNCSLQILPFGQNDKRRAVVIPSGASAERGICTSRLRHTFRNANPPTSSRPSERREIHRRDATCDVCGQTHRRIRTPCMAPLRVQQKARQRPFLFPVPSHWVPPRQIPIFADAEL